MTDLTGQTIHEYVIGEKIGEGGYGVVYRAHQPAVGREVAIKIIQPEKAAEAKFIQRFELEAQVIAELEHPHIVPLYDYWRDETGMVLVMRWLRGGNLRAAYRRPDWSLSKTTHMLEQIAGALYVAHEANVVHRDVKPDNILFDEFGNAYLADFGIAKRLDRPKNITEPANVIGSPAYLSPEQILRQTLTPRADIYTLGITLYESLTREHPFAADAGTIRMMLRQIQEAVPPVHEKNHDLPEAINAVIQRATHKDPASRYPDVLALYEDFRRAANL